MVVSSTSGAGVLCAKAVGRAGAGAGAGSTIAKRSIAHANGTATNAMSGCPGTRETPSERLLKA